MIDLDDTNLVISDDMQPDFRPMFGWPTRYKNYGAQKYRLYGKEFEIEDGYVSDGMSNPQALWSLTGLAPDGPQRLGVLVHDFGYGTTGTMGVEGTPLTQDQLDHAIARLSGCAGVPQKKCESIYFGLHHFGWIAWNRHKGLVSGPDLRTATLEELITYSNLHKPQ